MASSLIKNKKAHSHNNKVVIDEFSEVDGVVNYKGEKIGGSSTTPEIPLSTIASNALIKAADGYYVEEVKVSAQQSNILEKKTDGYYVKDQTVSNTANNALVKNADGFYVEKFQVSATQNNALAKYSDGYFVPKIPTNVAMVEDIATARQEIDDHITTVEGNMNTKYDAINTELAKVLSNSTKHNTHEFLNVVSTTLINVVTLSNLYTASNILLNIEFMIKNNSTTETATLNIKENEILTLQETLLANEVQRYKLPNITNMKINAKGKFSLYLYVDYI